MLPGFSPLMLLARPTFDPVTFTESGSWVVPDGIERIRIDSEAAPAVGAWTANAINILRLSRTVSSAGTDGEVLSYGWNGWNGSLVNTQLNKFPTGGGDGEAVTYDHRSTVVTYRYADSSAGAPRWSSITTISGVLNGTATYRFRSCSIARPDFTGITMSATPGAYANWPGSTVRWGIDGERYEYTGRGGTQSITASASGSLVSLADRGSFLPSGANAETWPPGGNTRPTSSVERTVVPGETLTISFSETGAGRLFTISPA